MAMVEFCKNHASYLLERKILALDATLLQEFCKMNSAQQNSLQTPKWGCYDGCHVLRLRSSQLNLEPWPGIG